jgi:hypothetical protein
MVLVSTVAPKSLSNKFVLLARSRPSFLLFAFAGIRVMCYEQRKSCQLYHTSHAAGQQTPMSDQPSLTITAVHTSAMPRLINRQLHFTSVQEMVCTIVAEGRIIVYVYLHHHLFSTHDDVLQTGERR